MANGSLKNKPFFEAPAKGGNDVVTSLQSETY